MTFTITDYSATPFLMEFGTGTTGFPQMNPESSSPKKLQTTWLHVIENFRPKIIKKRFIVIIRDNF